MKRTSRTEEVGQMAGNTTTTKKVFLRMMGLAIVLAFAAVPAFAGDGGPSPDGRTMVAVDTVSALATMSLPGCGVSVDENLRTCSTTMRLAGTSTNGNPTCQADRVYLNGSEQAGLCGITGVSRSFGASAAKVTTYGCDSVSVWRPDAAVASTVRLHDVEGLTWKLERFSIRASFYQHTAAGDVWQLESSAGAAMTGLTPLGSWAVFSHGSRTLVMWLNGQLVSTGSCADGVDAASFKLVLTGVGYLTR